MNKNEKLQEYLVEYKELTLDIMEELNGLGNIKGFLFERDAILDKVNSMDVSKEEIQQLGKELKLKELEDEMQMAVKKEKVRIKTKLASLNKMKSANMKYSSSTINYNAYGRFNKYK